ncbi:MAG TPA: hypothetical protein P5509_03560 [Bacteroidales bacterium]|nr:hypothetical protein [Bacteroidales bacterium]
MNSIDKIEDLHVSSSNTQALIKHTHIETDAEFKDRIEWEARHKARRLGINVTKKDAKKNFVKKTNVLKTCYLFNGT